MADPEDVVSLVNKQYDVGVRASMPYYMEAERCRLFARGDQWLTKDGTPQTEPGRDNWRVRLTINRIKPAVESIVNIIISSKPIIAVSPQTGEDADRRAANITQKLIRYYWEKLSIDGKIEQAAQWLVEEGNVFWLPRWDKDIGPVAQTEELDPVTGVTQSKQVALGDISVDIISPLSLVPEPGAVEIEDAAWYIITEIMTKDDAEKKYGVDLDGETGQNRSSYSSRFAPRSLSESENMRDRVEIKKYYERPTSKHPEGRLICISRNKELYSGPMPEEQFRDIIHTRCVRLNGEFWGQSYVASAMGPQVQYNKLRSQMIEDHRLMGRPKWVAPVGSVGTDQINSRPGQIIPYDPIVGRGREPHPVMGPGPNPTVFSMVNMAIEEINHLMSRNEASQGIAQGSVNSAEQVIALQQADRGRFGRLMSDMKNSIVKLGKCMIRIVRDNLEDERVLTVVGRHFQGEVIRFRAQDIASDANIHVDIESQLPWSKENARQQLMWMFSQGLITAEELKERIGMPINADVYETEQTHRANARKENDMLETMAFPPVETDDHQTHIEEHKMKINMPEHREEIIIGRLRGQPPQWLLNTLQHLEGHRAAIPPPPPPPAQTKLSLVAQLPEQEALRISQRTVANDNAGSPPEPIDGATGGTATPPGGMSGEAYVPPEEPIA